MLVLHRKDIVSTNQRMVLKDTRPLTRLGFPSSLTVQKQTYQMMLLIEMLSKNIHYFKSKPVNIPQITILLARGYHPELLTVELKNMYPRIMTKIKFELSEKPSKQQKEAQGQSGFVPVKAKWIVEGSNAWMERCKILIKNF